MHTGYIKISTFIITIIIFLILYAVSIFLVISHYEDKNVIVNIPTIVDDSNSSDELNNFTIIDKNET